METPDRCEDVAPEEAVAAAQTFLAIIRDEQERYLTSTRTAAARLAAGGGQLAQVAAMYNSLTRRFFDAQRCVLNKRAQVDADVRTIEAAAEADAEATVTAALVAAQEGRLDEVRPQLVEMATDWFATESGRSDDDAVQSAVRREITELGRAVMRSTADADALERVVDDALQPCEPDVVGAHDGLSQLLERWWLAELQEGKAAVDDANARAMMVRHIAGVEAAEMLDAAESVLAGGPNRLSSSLLPDEVVATLDSADSGAGLHSVLASLAETLQHTPTPPDDPTPGPIITFPSTSARFGHDGFRRFWETVPETRRARRILGRRPA